MFDSQPVAQEKHGNENTANPAKKVSVAVFAQFMCGFFTSYVFWQQIEAKTVRDRTETDDAAVEATRATWMDGLATIPVFAAAIGRSEPPSTMDQIR